MNVEILVLAYYAPVPELIASKAKIDWCVFFILILST